MAEVVLTKSNFDETVASGVVLVDFWASWCGPCRMLAPTIAGIAEEYAGKITVGKVDVDEEGELAARFGIASIPTVVVLKDGKLVGSSIGFKPKEVFTGLLAQAGVTK